MDTFFHWWLRIMIGLIVLALILDIAKHLSKKKMIEHVLKSEERRQRYIRMDSNLVLHEKKLLWQLLVILPVMFLSIYYFLPRLFYIPLVILLFCPIILEDYFYRKSFLKAIDKL